MKNKKTRLEAIMKILESQNNMTIEELSERLAVSNVTIRRDIQQLLENNLITRVNGYTLVHKQHRLSRAEPIVNFLSEKKRIAAAAVSIIQEHDIIFMDGGTTQLEIAKRIAETLSHLTIVTNSIDVAYELYGKKDILIYVSGGSMGEHSEDTSIIGPLAENMVSRFRANISFIGTLGIHTDKGITDPRLASAQIKNMMINNSTKSVLVADHSKFGKVNAAFVCPTNKFDLIITDEKAPKKDIEQLISSGIPVQLV
ncbi:MAG: hypothetical protein K0S39_2818 [Paenibacillus sp.]|jgi:DeoR/GlpR family transcriptional regulator of sugar metabolism|nr:hypothetical protein [Paenibacillus sp.]